MGEIIAFKMVKCGAHQKPPPGSPAKIVTFTGGWHAPISGRGEICARDMVKAAWYERCWKKLFLSLGSLRPWITVSLHGAALRPDQAAQASGLAHRTIPSEAKWGGVSS